MKLLFDQGTPAPLRRHLSGHSVDTLAEKGRRAVPRIRRRRLVPGNPPDYDREHCVDLVQIRTFLHATQPEPARALRLGDDCPARRKFLARLQGEINKRGTIDVLRRGVKHGPHDLGLFHGTPSAGKETARRLFELNRFTVARPAPL